ncbi:2-hydroxymuconic semialdehyde dehydrogenase [Rhodococcus sp. ABRD24]|uniref:2-hydroxymuconic semialdehyde dehydrogenase n=1 Tax=Rhodococcus sp. ABRD24 TaxID=2507582 RepID=UPI00103ABCB8|nr:2-hydroxymuconic semialdehyde dehydrogenase [Rhodococcus sp. ABRD24]QBJ95896.1 2-hydroxymuconic semialdehyde dehydrogenase [Rhodococcus sp. ABRD24]
MNEQETSEAAHTQPRHYIGGQFSDTGTSFDVIHPADGSVVGCAPEADAATVDAAVQAARAALLGPWGQSSVEERCALLRAIADGIEARFDEFVAAEVADTGKPESLARSVDIPRSIETFRAYADLAWARSERAFTTPTPDGAGALNYTVHRPRGVVAIVAPWNLPLLLLSLKVAPALVTGNAIVAKPSELTPTSATMLAEVIHDCGLVEGAFNVVHGFGGGSAGAHLTSHPDIDAVAFTGDSGTGRAIMGAAAEQLTPVSFELGGKNPALVFADADFDAAVEGTVRSAFTNAGQICLCTERVYVERPIFDDFVAALADRAKNLSVGRPYDADTWMGPLASADHRSKVLGYYRLAEQEGAKIHAGGGVPVFGDERDSGFFVDPTVITGLSRDARTVREEIFGPICHVAPFDDEATAVELANESAFGLAASLWTSSLSRAHRVAPRLQNGIVWVNCWNLRDHRTPFGGLKASGIGREGGEYSLDFFSEPVNVCVKL